MPAWVPDPPYQLPEGPRTVLERLKVEDLSAAPGVLHGLTYPLAPDLEGMHTLLFKPMLDGLPALQWEERAHWFRSVGLQFVVADGQRIETLPINQSSRSAGAGREAPGGAGGYGVAGGSGGVCCVAGLGMV